MSVLVCESVIKTYPGAERPVLDCVSLNFSAPCFVSITGRSGSGKSTLLKILSGLLTPDSGTVTVNGQNVHLLNAKQRGEFRSLSIGIVFQDGFLVDDFTVLDNVLSPLYIAKKRPDKEYLGRLLEMTELTEHQKKYPGELSGGMLQRAAIARALIAKPKIIFADEPTGNLDSGNEKRVMELFKAVRKEFDTSIVQVTHSDYCAGCGDGIIYINDGKVAVS
jgi:ABC-type lipoprotein export system ATPase subunit